MNTVQTLSITHSSTPTITSPIPIRVAINIKTDKLVTVLLDFSLTVKAAPHECVIRTGQPST